MKKKLTELIDGILVASNFKTYLIIKIADLAAQSLGFRSTRQVGDGRKNEVTELFNDYLDQLVSLVYEYKYIIDHNEECNESTLKLSDEELESKLIEVILYSLLFNDVSFFNETFFE